ncbi:MAG TPA: hypothetical protein PLY87_05880 [Planctomycetaceae bacterium]|nr:hypothetical protein [Planctomycetaceae bacterium]HQZ64582.1 hypothetical protein [Planctomycetaceae bacterium]
MLRSFIVVHDAVDEADVESLAVELVQTSLAVPHRYNHLTLCPYQSEAVGRKSRRTCNAFSSFRLLRIRVRLPGLSPIP